MTNKMVCKLCGKSLQDNGSLKVHKSYILLWGIKSFVNSVEYLSKVMAHLKYTRVNTMTNKFVCKLCDNSI